MLDVEYARRGDMSIAYQVSGSGPVDVMFSAGLVSHLDLLWSDPYAAAFFRRLRGLGRLILSDKPGTGLSDPIFGMPTVEQRVGDLLAVLDAVGSTRVILVGLSEAAAPAALLAATHPDRVEALVLVSGFARSVSTETWLPEEEDYIENVWWKAAWWSAEHWGDGTFMLALSPWMRSSPVYRRLSPSIERTSASPAMARSIFHGIRRYDVVPALGAIHVPTLVVNRSEEFIPAACGRDLAQRIPGARHVELPGDEHLCFYGGDDILDAIERFVGGGHLRPVREGRALITVLFTDIVDSTSIAATVGDEQWRAIRDQHDDIVADEVERHEGRLVKQLGDGILATFQRPLLSIRCARALADRLADLGIEIRAGIHTGECELVEDDIAGIAVHIGARIAGLAEAGQVLVSSTVRDLVLGSGVQFSDRGIHQLKGVPGQWGVSAVVADASTDQARSSDGTPRRRAGGAAADSMRRVDKVLATVAARAPTLTQRVLRIATRPRRPSSAPRSR